MKKPTLLILLIIFIICPSTIQAEGGFGAKKELRKRNKRTKKINRKHGVGFIEQQDNWDWMLPKVIDRKEAIHG